VNLPLSTLVETLRDAAAALASVSDVPRFDAELLMAHALGINRSELLLRQAELAVPRRFARYLKRRLADEPVAYIIGTQAFWDLELTVTPDVLIPRADSETLITAALDLFTDHRAELRILDLGTGSGALLLAALSAFPNAAGLGIDASKQALDIASLNAGRLGFGPRAKFQRASWRNHGWANELGQFDLILCNPPYVEDDAPLDPMVADYEPHSALFAGPEGLDDYRILIPQIAALLRHGGFAIFEIGHMQAADVGDLADDAGLSTEIRHDLAGKPRALCFSLGIEDAND
jgi:release factor glutamine methyltransferase